MIKAVIFDLDGTLLNTLDSIAYCGNLSLSHFGLPNVNTEIYPQFVGHGAEVLIEKIFKYVDAEERIFPEFRRYYLDTYNKNGLYKTTPYDGIEALLDELRSQKIKTAVLSNKPHSIVKNACRSFFENKFDIIYGQRDNIPTKPNPFMMYEIIREFNTTAKQCIYCGDSGVDIETGKNSGVLTLGASWGFYGDTQFANADFILKSPSDLLNYLK